ncbi:hypothetical protein [Microbulbifer guangxiensis]|uniref:hypothetical protein n=1 Tax=Microbulbifer guangxiensis TaxID=2904249 RepID=UPI001F3C74A3|nr:hypothetical protein [Microbulbifer guangxiensis]
MQWLLALGLLLPIGVFAQEVSDSESRQGGGGASPYLSFCQQRFYEEEDGRLLCNWAVNFNFACFVSYPSNKVIQAGSRITDPEVVGECDNGEPIIKLLHY